jgi:opacity protein-like surface antigen
MEKTLMFAKLPLVKFSGRFLVFALCLVTVLPAARAAETDAAVSVYGSLNTTSNTSNGLTQIPANSIGGMLEFRHIIRSLVGFEGTYSFNPANQEYSYPVACSGASCPLAPYAAGVSAVAHEITGDWVLTRKIKKVNAFVVAGAGIVFNQPSKGFVYSYSLSATPAFQSAPAPTSSASSPVFVYGVGADWALSKRLGLRFQYRGNIHKAPALTTALSSTNVESTTYEPMFGAYYRF